MVLKPKCILQVLEEKGLPVPKKQQVSNYFTPSREKFYGTSTSGLGEIEAWCQ